jgi:hypothetical protein
MGKSTGPGLPSPLRSRLLTSLLPPSRLAHHGTKPLNQSLLFRSTSASASTSDTSNDKLDRGPQPDTDENLMSISEDEDNEDHPRGVEGYVLLYSYVRPATLDIDDP